jgi:hypothetical protein
MTEVSKYLAYLKVHYPVAWLAVAHQRNHKGEPLTFTGHEYLKGLYMDNSPYIVVRKSTQCGVTEYLIAATMARTILEGRSVFYVLPNWGLLSRFVKMRMDATIEKTAFYASIAWNEQQEEKSKGRFFESMSLKRYGQGVVALIGSQSRSGFTEFPADDVIVDEEDECDQEILPMAAERLSHSKDPRWIRVGNPTFQSRGISSEYAQTDMKRWFIRCPKCGEAVNPDFFAHVVREDAPGVYVLRDENWEAGNTADIRMIHECGGALDRFIAGEWVAEHPRIARSGYHISKLFSTNARIETIVDRFNQGLVNDTVMQRFYNAELGLPYTASGAKIDRMMLDACIEDYTMPDGCTEPCIAGVDVGVVLHVRINQLLPDGRERAVYIGSVADLEDLHDLTRKYRIVCGVIDAMPEIRLARKVVSWRGWFKAVFHGSSKDHLDKVNGESRQISAGRTEILDSVKEKILSGKLVLPRNVASLPEYYAHMEASVRVYDEKRNTYDWVEGDAPDHLLFAEAYLQMARRLLASGGS